MKNPSPRNLQVLVILREGGGEGVGNSPICCNLQIKSIFLLFTVHTLSFMNAGGIYHPLRYHV